MTGSAIDRALSSALDGRLLLDHPFYRRWEAGDVSRAELAGYAAQYRHFERQLPGFLAGLAAALPESPARELVEANRADEEGDPVAHTELFERFAEGVGAGWEEPSPAMAGLLDTYRDLLARGAVPALGCFLAYESQAAAVAGAKADGLRRHHGLDDRAVSFWDHHASVDARHGRWAREATAPVADDPALLPAVRRAADAWWAFLDERQALAAA